MAFESRRCTNIGMTVIKIGDGAGAGERKKLSITAQNERGKCDDDDDYGER